MPGYNLPDHVHPGDPYAPWNQVAKPTRVTIRVHYAGQVQEFEAEWDWEPSEEEVAENFFDNVHLEIEYL